LTLMPNSDFRALGEDLLFQHTIIIPAYNEAQRIAPSLDHILAYTEEKQWSAEIIVVDDGSSDTTAEIVSHYALRSPSVRLITNPVHRGKGYCVRTGAMNAGGRMILVVDADLPASMERASLLFQALAEGADVAIASRWLQPDLQQQRQSLLRRVLSRFFNYFTHVLLGLSFKDTQCGLKAFTGDAARRIFGFQTVSGWAFDAELLVISQGLGLMIKEIPIQMRHDRRSKLKPFLHGPEMLSDVLHIGWCKLWGRYPSFLPSTRFGTGTTIRRTPWSSLVPTSARLALALLVLMAASPLTRDTALETVSSSEIRQTHPSAKQNARSDSRRNGQHWIATAQSNELPKDSLRRAMPEQVLVVSYDKSALATRQKLLNQAGYKVTSALGLPKALDWCRKGRFDLIVMGHTIPRQDKQVLIEEARRFSNVPVLSIRQHGDARLGEADYSVDSLEGGTALVTAVHAVLAAHAQGGKRRPEELMNSSNIVRRSE